MLSQIGFIFLFLCFISNVFIVLLGFINRKNLSKIFFYLSLSSFIFISLSFLTLIFIYLKSDFSNYNVFQNSHTSKPIFYKITASWGNHEGSMLLWLLIMCFYTFVFSFNNKLEKKLKKLTMFFQSLLFLCFCSFVIFSSNPFLINPIKTNEGLGFNPILQDPALAIHPPVLYLGYVGFSIVLSLALAGLISKKIDINWAKTTRHYSIFCWSMLTAGITLGAFWAYYELGWGGWWFWDPVENISIMPWIAGLCLVHSLIIYKEDELLKRWIIFLSILCFSLSVFGTFLVRSGILTSVHSFASDSLRGIFILLLFLVITGFSLLLFIFHAPEKKTKLNLLLFNKTTAIIVNNIVMLVACFTVLLGTIYPIIIEVITNERISVGEPYYNSTVLPIILPGLLLMSIAPALSWQSNKLYNSKVYFYILFLVSVICILISLFSDLNAWGFIGIFTGLWIIFASLYSIKNKQKLNLYTVFINNNSLLAHLGVGILIIGITCSSVFKSEYQKNIKVNEKINFGNYKLELEKIETLEKNNYQSLIGVFALYNEKKLLSKIKPEKRYYYVSKTITTEAGIYHNIFQDFYIVLGEKQNDFWKIKIYQNPLINLIWLGAFIMFFSGLISLRKK